MVLENNVLVTPIRVYFQVDMFNPKLLTTTTYVVPMQWVAQEQSYRLHVQFHSLLGGAAHAAFPPP